MLTAAGRAVDALLIKASRLFFQMLHCKNRPACNNDNVDENKLEQYFAPILFLNRAEQYCEQPGTEYGQQNIVQACFHQHCYRLGELHFLLCTWTTYHLKMCMDTMYFIYCYY